MRHKLTKEQQISGLRKALRNPNTPKQFLASMRKRLKKLAPLLLLLLLPSFAYAQTATQVSGTIVDPTGLPYAGATIQFQLVPSTASPTVNSAPISGYIGSVQLDSTGHFSTSLFCNSAGGGCSVISPSGTQWQFQINYNGVQPPLGVGPVSFSALITITGATQDVSATLNAVAPRLLVNGPFTYNKASVNQTASVSATTMATPGVDTEYLFSVAVRQVNVGTSCTGAGSVAVSLIYTDPGQSSAYTVVVPFTVSGGTSLVTTVPLTNTTIAVANNGSSVIQFRAKASTNVQFSTTYTAGSGCSPGQAYTVHPILTAM
jgi:hypothetical protein